jgi:hypothetical protein
MSKELAIDPVAVREEVKTKYNTAALMGLKNVEFREGLLEEIPVESLLEEIPVENGWADIVVSNRSHQSLCWQEASFLGTMAGFASWWKVTIQ